MKKIITAAFAFLLVLPLMACGKNSDTTTKNISVASAIESVETSITTIVDGANAIDPTDNVAIENFIKTQFNGGLTANVSLKMNNKNALKLTYATVFGENFLTNGPETYVNANIEGNEMSMFNKPTADIETSYSYLNIKKANYNTKIKSYEFGNLFNQQSDQPTDQPGSGTVEENPNPATLAINALAATATSPETDEILAKLEQIKVLIADPTAGNTAKKVTYKNNSYDIIISFNNYFVGGFIAGLMRAQDPTMTDEQLMALAQSIGSSIKTFEIAFNYNASNNIQGLNFSFKMQQSVTNVKQTVEASIGVKFGATIPEMTTELTNAELISASDATEATAFRVAFMGSIENTFIGNIIQNMF